MSKNASANLLNESGKFPDWTVSECCSLVVGHLISFPNNTWQSEVQFSSGEKHWLYLKETSAQLSRRVKQHNGSENHLKFLLKGLGKEYRMPLKSSQTTEKMTIIALHRNSYWESIRLGWISIDFNFSVEVLLFTSGIGKWTAYKAKPHLMPCLCK